MHNITGKRLGQTLHVGKGFNIFCQVLPLMRLPSVYMTLYDITQCDEFFPVTPSIFANSNNQHPEGSKVIGIKLKADFSDSLGSKQV